MDCCVMWKQYAETDISDQSCKSQPYRTYRVFCNLDTYSKRKPTYPPSEVSFQLSFLHQQSYYALLKAYHISGVFQFEQTVLTKQQNGRTYTPFQTYTSLSAGNSCKWVGYNYFFHLKEKSIYLDYQYSLCLLFLRCHITLT